MATYEAQNGLRHIQMLTLGHLDRGVYSCGLYVYEGGGEGKKVSLWPSY